MPAPTRSERPVAVFGKLPAHGDFVARGMGPRARDLWDQWLTAHLPRDLSPGGLHLSEVAPHPWCALILPSTDAVGRAYPLTFRIALDAPWDLDAIEAALTDLTTGVLALDAPDIDTLCAALPPFSAPEDGTLAPGLYAWQPGQNRYHAAPGVDPSRAISAALSSS